MVLVFDDAHARHAAVVLLSAGATLEPGRRFRATLITSDLSREGEAGLRRIAASLPNLELNLRRADASRYTHWLHGGHISTAAYLRLELHLHLDPEVARVIYLDTDVICVDSLHHLMAVDLADCPVGAVRDTSTPFASSPRGLVRHAELGIPADAPYFNSGVMVIDVPVWRVADPLAFGEAYVAQHGDVQQALDQELLNACFSGRWTELDLRWNVSPRLLSVDSWADPRAREIFAPKAKLAVDEPGIVHFLGPRKPWHFRSSVKWRVLYMRYARRSPFDRSRLAFLRWRATEARHAGRKRAQQVRRGIRRWIANVSVG